eukprot:432293-Hanusia_phi.AAC.1
MRKETRADKVVQDDNRVRARGEQSRGEGRGGEERRGKEWWSTSVLGCDPIPTTTRSQSILFPWLSITLSTDLSNKSAFLRALQLSEKIAASCREERRR